MLYILVFILVIIDEANQAENTIRGVGTASRFTSSPSTKTYYNPNPGYDAYWTDGHWIFGTTSTRPPSTTSTITRPLVCRKPCDIVYRYVGLVCAHQVEYIDNSSTVRPSDFKNYIIPDTIYPHLRTFNTYCEFLNFQCSNRTWNDMSWVFIHFGACLKDIADANENLANGLGPGVFFPVHNNKILKERKRYVLDRYKESVAKVTDQTYKNFSPDDCLLMSCNCNPRRSNFNTVPSGFFV